MSKFHEKAFFKNVRKSWAKATRRSSEFAINMNKKLSPTGLTRAQLRDRGYEMIGSPVVESSAHANPFKFGWTSVGGNAIATDVMIKRDYRIPFEYTSSTSMWSRRIGDNIADVALEGEACCAPSESKDACEIRGVRIVRAIEYLRFTSSNSTWLCHTSTTTPSLHLQLTRITQTNKKHLLNSQQQVPECASGLKCTLKEANIAYRIDFNQRYAETLVGVGVHVCSSGTGEATKPSDEKVDCNSDQVRSLYPKVEDSKK